jgi:ABC-type glycerol-3-phosphate transport system substrate-binding protein
MKKILSVLCVLILMMGCGTRKEDENMITIRVGLWGTPEESKIIASILKEWQKDHPNIKVRLDHTNYGGYVSKTLTQVAGGAAPDIICTEVDMFVNYVKKGVLEPLDRFIKLDKSFHLDDFFPEVLDRFTVDDKLYVIPRDTAPFACVYYNKDLFDVAGIAYPTDEWTWDEMLDKAKKMTILGNNRRYEQYGFYAWAWQNFIYSNGGQLVDDVKNPTQCLMGMQRSLEGLQFYRDLIHEHHVMPAPTAMTNIGMGVQSMFVAGKLAMFSSGIWETPTLRNKTKLMASKGQKFRWDVAMFPKGRHGDYGFGTGGSGYGILKTSRHKKEAWEVVKALCNESGQTMLGKSGLAQPANQRIAKGEAWAENKDLPVNKKMLNKAVKYVTYNPFHERWAEIQQLYIIPKLELVFNGKMSVKDAVMEFLPVVNKTLKE